MKKFLLLTVTVIALILAFSVTALADSEGENGTPVSQTASENCGETVNEGSNTFSEIYHLILTNSDKVFSALAFFSSLFLVFIYKRGLIPIINTGLSAIKKSSDTFGQTASKSLVTTEESLSFLTDKFASCLNTLDDISKYVDTLSEKLEAVEGEKNNAKTFKAVMLSQIDMLYEIFMNSTLPQYSKDALGEKVAQMKKSIACGEENV